MSEHDNVAKPGRRHHRAVLGGLAAGALLGATIGGPATADAAEPSIHEQFQDSFTPGAVDLTAAAGTIVVTES
ncbi:hypothetical protein [Micromonospora sp. LOL_024]|uniref:hypothetical protein n=1 Tax=Micromonospora sp. LOL_024 TaxID=3345412 RepID=UPI003A87F410